MAYKNKEDALRYYRKYHIENRDRKVAASKAWYSKNREKILEKMRQAYVPSQRRLKTEEEKKRKRVLWQEKYRDKKNLYMRNWNRKNKKRLSKYRKIYYLNRLTLPVQYSRLIANAKERDLEVQVDFELFCETISLACHYCTEQDKRRGIDRIDSTLGYLPENIVSCCKICNYMKRNLSIDDFKEHIKKIYINLDAF